MAPLPRPINLNLNLMKKLASFGYRTKEHYKYIPKYC